VVRGRRMAVGNMKNARTSKRLGRSSYTKVPNSKTDIGAENETNKEKSCDNDEHCGCHAKRRG